MIVQAKQIAFDADTDMTPLFRFVNLSGTDCFVNSLIWCFVHLPVRRLLQDADPANAFVREFTDLMGMPSRMPQSTSGIRSLFDGSDGLRDFNDGQQQCVVEFYEAVMNRIPPAISRTMSFVRTQVTVCSFCREVHSFHVKQVVLM